MNDLKMVERNDFDRYELIRTQNNVSSLSQMIKKLYYYTDLKWFLYYLDSFGNETSIEWKDKLYINGSDFEEVIKHGEDNIYEMNDYETVEGEYDIMLSLVGVTISDGNFFKSFQNEMGSIRFTCFELVFSCVDDVVPYEVQNAILSTDCFSNMKPIVHFKTSIMEALSYVEKCAKACGVVPSLVPRGDLFFGLIYRNSNLDWSLCKWMYRNSVIPIFDVLKFPVNYDILCYCFDKIMGEAKFHYLEVKTSQDFKLNYLTFRELPKVVENMDRIKELFSIVVEKGKEEEIFTSSKKRCILQMAQSLDKLTISRFNHFKFTDSVEDENNRLYLPFHSWANDFIYGYFEREPTCRTFLQPQLNPPHQTNKKNSKKLITINTIDLHFQNQDEE